MISRSVKKKRPMSHCEHRLVKTEATLFQRKNGWPNKQMMIGRVNEDLNGEINPLIIPRDHNIPVQWKKRPMSHCKPRSVKIEATLFQRTNGWPNKQMMMGRVNEYLNGEINPLIIPRYHNIPVQWKQRLTSRCEPRSLKTEAKLFPTNKWLT